MWNDSIGIQCLVPHQHMPSWAMMRDSNSSNVAITHHLGRGIATITQYYRKYVINKRAKFNVLLSEKAPDVPSGGRLLREHLRFYVPLCSLPVSVCFYPRHAEFWGPFLTRFTYRVLSQAAAKLAETCSSRTVSWKSHLSELFAPAVYCKKSEFYSILFDYSDWSSYDQRPASVFLQPDSSRGVRIPTQAPKKCW